MTVAVVYVFPLNGQGVYFDWAFRFVNDYHHLPGGLDHRLVVVCNGSPVTDEARFLFGAIPNVQFLEHDNSGYDVGAYQHAARDVPADLMVFFGTSTYLKRPGWLARMAQVYGKHGDGLYGAMGNRGSMWVNVHPHIRSTAFWMRPALLNEYPHRITAPEQRYGFEHGPNCLTSWIYRRGLKAWVISWDGAYQQEQWDMVPEGYHRGSQTNLLAGDRITAPPYHHTA